MGRSRMFGDEKPERDEATASPRTTIVGGRPPETGAELPPVPTGIEQLLRLAAIDSTFRDVLLERRGDAAEAAGLTLTANERAIVDAIPESQLLAMAEHVPPPPPQRRRFLQQAAASAVIALGGAALSACDQCMPTRGIQDDMPPPRSDGVVPTQGIAPDVPPPRPDEAFQTRGITHDVPPPRPTEPRPPTGIAPDMPPAPGAPPRPQGSGVQTIGGEMADTPPERPERTHTPGRGGSAPDLPPRK